MQREAEENVKVVFCNCGYIDIIDGDVKASVLKAGCASGVDLEVTQDLCELAAKKDAKLKKWAQAGMLYIIACHSRAVRWLFEAGGAWLDIEKTEFLNMRTDSAEEIVSKLPGGDANGSCQRDIEFGEKGDWMPWFPVIDHDRCRNCKQCLDFCLFGVYELDEQKQVRVVEPANCKTNCPACARVCLSKAIIFPKYTEGPINGDKVDDSETAGVDIGGLADVDIAELLRRRNKKGKRFSKDSDGLDEKGCSELIERLGIPADVLQSLSVSEMAALKKKGGKG